MHVLSPELIETLKIQARQSTLYDDSEYDLYGSCGGNYDDAYNIGQSDGETSLARTILTSLNISWEMAFTTVFRVNFTESERGWGLDTWHTDYSSYADAMHEVNLINDKFKTGEDYYVHADYVGPIVLEVPDNVEEEKKMAKETVAQRRAHETQEANARAEKWEAEKPMRLLRALARANDLEVKARVGYVADNILYYEFDFGDYTHYYDPVVALGESTMDLINQELDNIEAKRVKERRLRQVKEELLARLSDEEREALGL